MGARPPADHAVHIVVDLHRQTLELLRADGTVQHWPVSTAAKGAGEQRGSGCTPRGLHRVVARIGGDCPVNTVFVARRPTGEVYTAEMAAGAPTRDWILTRILWLQGLERGRNRGGEVDTLRRFIYIHGCPDSEPVGVPRSHGCIRMRNADLVALFAQVPLGTQVHIQDGSA
ncbi:MAG: L,D-transpeptidase [Rhodocyclaceae bacterium]|nr:L,D-transpeptidase [Rhodocyclaceae bacterium]